MMLIKKCISSVLIFNLLFFQGLVYPIVAYAQEIESTPSSEISSTPAPEDSPEVIPSPTPSESPTPSPTDLPTPVPEISSEITPSPTLIPSLSLEASTSANLKPSPNPVPTPIEFVWTENSGNFTTEILKLSTPYKFPPNEKVSLTFTKLPESSGTISVRELDVPSTIENAGSKDYEITSSMPNGSFSFDLTLPTNDPNKEVLTSQDGQNYSEVSNEKVISSDTITVKGITHLTHFIVADETADFSHPVINEFVSNTSNGEWVELYNPTSETIDLSGWQLRELTDPDGSPTESEFLTLSGEIPPKGFIIAAGAGLNNTGDWIGLYNSDLTPILLDQVSFGNVVSPYNVNVVANPSSEQSVGRTIDGGPDFQTFATPTRGLSNGTTLNTLYVDDDWSSPDNDGDHAWGFDAFSSIQDAIDFAPADSTINVEAGNYEESLVIDKSLTLIGNPGDESIGPDASAPLIFYCGKVIRIEASEVSVSGFVLDGQDCSDLIIRLGTNVTGVTISDNETRYGFRGIGFGGGNSGDAAGSSTVDNNYIHSNNTGIRIDSGSNNIIQNNTISGNGEGILLSANFSTPNGNQILNNQITENDYGVYVDDTGTLTISDNIISNNYYEGIYLNYATSTLDITRNTVESNQNGGSSGIYINQITSGNANISENTISSNGSYGIYINGVDNTSEVLIDGNTIESNSSVGIYLANSVTNTTITNNTLQNNGTQTISTGIVVDSASGNKAHENTISGNGDIEVQNNDNFNAFDATLNWWGTASASEIFNIISGLVTFSPWYIDVERTTTAVLRTGSSITSFNFESPSVFGAIDDTNNTVTLYVPNGTDVTFITPTIEISEGATIYPNSGEMQDFTNAITYTVTAEDNSQQEYVVTVNVVEENQTIPDTSGNVTVTNTNPTAVITSLTQAVNLTITSGTTNPKIDYSSLISGGTGTIPQTTIDSTSANIAIPASTTVTSADTTWNGVIAAPTVTTVTLPEIPGETKTVSTAIEVGFSGGKLSFDKAVRLLLSGQVGKRAGYSRPNTAFTEITNICTGDTQVAGDSLITDGDCKIDSGADLVIWTKHFTKFASYTQTTNSVTTSSSGGGGVGSDGGDGLGCAVKDCSGVHPAVQNLSLGISTLGSRTGFASGVLGTSAEKIEEEIVTQENLGEVQGESIVATPVPQEKSSSGFFGAIGGFFGTIWRFILSLFGR